MDSGILGPWIAPDNLTITVSVGHSLFDERYGLETEAEKAAKNDALPERFAGCGAVPWRSAAADLRQYPGYGDPRPARYHQAHAGSAERALEAGRVYLRPRRAQQRKETPVNLLGFKDGTANPDSSDAR
jgi:deferrochelatase/peroxidase EfeB